MPYPRPVAASTRVPVAGCCIASTPSPSRRPRSQTPSPGAGWAWTRRGRTVLAGLANVQSSRLLGSHLESTAYVAIDIDDTASSRCQAEYQQQFFVRRGVGKAVVKSLLLRRRP